MAGKKTQQAGSGDRLKRLAPIALIAIICIYYFSTMVPLRMLPQNSYYNLMADAFHEGSLSLLVKPRKELLELTNPYDPTLNGPYRLHDATLYNGKYYLYFGPVPALVLFLPVELVSGVKVPQHIAVTLFLCVGFIASVVALKLLLQTIRPPLPPWMFPAGILTLGLCNLAPCILLRPDVYEVAISCAYWLGMTSLAFLLSGILSPGAPMRKFAAASLCAGLAVGARPTYIVYSLVLLLALIIWLFNQKKRSGLESTFRAAMCLLAPFGVCILGILFYNYSRFGKPMEFGTHYVLDAYKAESRPFFSTQNFFPWLKEFLISSYVLDGTFPFVHLPRGPHFGEPIIGSLIANPLELILLPWLAISAFAHRRTVGTHFAKPVLLPAAWGWLMLLLTVILAHGLVRYHLDYEGALLVAGLYAWCDLTQRTLSQPRVHRALKAGGAFLLAYGCWVGFALGWNDISPRAIRSFYEGNDLMSQGRSMEAEQCFLHALGISPSFYLADINMAMGLAARGEGGSSAQHFSEAMQKFIATNVAYKNRGYLPAFQGLSINNPLGEYCRLASELLRHRQMESALLALDGMVHAFASAGFSGDALNIARSVKEIAVASDQADFANGIEQRLNQYRHDLPPIR